MHLVIFVFLSLTLCAPFVPYIFVSGNLSVIDLIFPFLLLLSMKENFTLPVPSIILVMFALISLLSLIVNSYNYELIPGELFFIIRWLFYSIFAFFIFNAVSKEAELAKVVLGAVAFSVFISTVVVWYLWILSPRYVGSVPMLHLIHESAPVLVNRNYFGFFLSIGFPLWFVFAFNYRKRGFVKLLLLLVTLLLMISSILTFSKGSWLASFLPIIFLFIVTMIRRGSFSYKVRTVFKVSVMLLLFSAFVLNHSVEEKYAITGEVTGRIAGSAETNTQRLQFVEDSFMMMMLNPLIGVGPGNYRAEAINSGFIPTGDPHNALLWLGAELGIIGFLLALFCVVHLGYVIYKIYNTQTQQSKLVSELLLVVYLALILNIVVHGLPFSMKHFWVVYAVAYALYRSRPVFVDGLGRRIGFSVLRR